MRIFIFTSLLFQVILSQGKLPNVFDFVLDFRGLTGSDITIPAEFLPAGEKSPSSDVKLVLPRIRNMMSEPLNGTVWLDSLSYLEDSTADIVVNRLFQMISDENNLKYHSLRTDRGYESIISLIRTSRSDRNSLLSVFKTKEISFIESNVKFLIQSPENENITDIFLYNKSRDSSTELTRYLTELFSKASSGLIADYGCEAFYTAYSIYRFYSDEQDNRNSLIRQLNIKKSHFQKEINDDGIKIAVGGTGNNKYTGSYDFIIDLGGDDVYLTENLHTNGISCIIDLGGNDFYSSENDFSLAGGFFSSSFIFDKSGDDKYYAKGFCSLGAGLAGVGVILDEGGNDTYRSGEFSQGAGCFGVGLLIDRNGNDVYIANSYSQGFGMTQGAGCIIDNKGNDSYLADMRSLDIGRYEDHYVSMCQGYGLGLRPFYGGGIGLIIEGEGNDIYNTDIFGQGGAYWYGLGAIIDKAGHDKYNGYQYSQGAGIHLAVGLLKDYDGWDFYSSNGVSQGCGHDFGFGLLWDVKGNDNYSAYSLSQGAGNANGIGILIDENGTDGYLNKFPSNSRGYGNPRREFGSIGIFLDVSGDDFYSQTGLDSTLNSSSQWGVFTDYYLKDLPSEFSADNFKVPLDTNREFYISELFVMAKTIEPRFSLWQEVGFNRLVRDSTETADYIISKLGSEDHRDAQLMRQLALKIPESICNTMKEFLTNYLNGKVSASARELSFACYLIGETKNPSAKEVLFQLTSDENFRVRSNAINALGKIKLDDSDISFKEKVSSRLFQLSLEDSDKRLYSKDIAFALSNYPGRNSMLAAVNLMNHKYYAARFLAAECLKKYGDDYFLEIMNSGFGEQIKENYLLKNFLTSIQGLNEKQFMQIAGLILPEFQNDEIGSVILSEEIRLRQSKSTEPDFKKWCDDVLGILNVNYLFKN